MKLFLASYFSTSAPLLPKAFNEDYRGKKVVFIPTASIPEKVNFYVDTDRKALIKLGFEIIELEISTASQDTISEYLTSADAIFVCGGNTFYLLQELKKKSADKLLVEQIKKGKLYIGSSAGSVICSQDIEYLKFMDSPKAAPDLNGDYSALGIVGFYIVPHSDNFPFKKAAAKIIAECSDKLDLKAIDNKKAVIVNDDKTDIISL